VAKARTAMVKSWIFMASLRWDLWSRVNGISAWVGGCWSFKQCTPQIENTPPMSKVLLERESRWSRGKGRVEFLGVKSRCRWLRRKRNAGRYWHYLYAIREAVQKAH
jgi:hypothetical protein